MQRYNLLYSRLTADTHCFHEGQFMKSLESVWEDVMRGSLNNLDIDKTQILRLFPHQKQDVIQFFSKNVVSQFFKYWQGLIFTNRTVFLNV